MTTLNKLQAVKSDIVRIDEKWQIWEMHDLIENIHENREETNQMTQEGRQKKEKGIGMLEIQTKKRGSQSVFIVMQSTGQKSVTNMKQQRKENNISEIKNCASIVERKDTKKTSVSVEDVSIANQNIIAAYAKRKKKKVLY